MPPPPARLFHFSDDPAIAVFTPRPVRVPSQRPPAREWLDGPLVWAIDERHQPMYLFPRECPRILLWPLPRSTAGDIEKWWAGSPARMIAFIERAWLGRLTETVLHRYELPTENFESLDDAGMWVARSAVRPRDVVALGDLAGELAARQVDLRVLDSLAPLKGVWDTSLHASGIRLRNAASWT